MKTVDAPFKVMTYCGCCQDTKPHYIKPMLCDNKCDWYECASCLHLINVPKVIQ